MNERKIFSSFGCTVDVKSNRNVNVRARASRWYHCTAIFLLCKKQFVLRGGTDGMWPVSLWTNKSFSIISITKALLHKKMGPIRHCFEHNAWSPQFTFISCPGDAAIIRCCNCNCLEKRRIECNNIFLCEILLNSENKLIFIAFSSSYSEGTTGQISAE